MSKTSIVLIMLLLLMDMIGSFNISLVIGSAPEVYYSVELVAIPPLTDINTSAYDLQTPATPASIGQNFTAEIHLRNATVTNVPAGIHGVEVHFYFGNILDYCTPIGCANMLGQLGGVLPEPASTVVYGIGAGFYDDADNPIVAPPYTNATQYIVQAESTAGPWYNVDGLITTITFQIIYQPQHYLGEPDFYAPLQITFADLVDFNGTAVSFLTVQGTLQIDALPTTVPPYHNVAVRNVVPSRTALSQAYISSINVTVNVFVWWYPETFNLTAYANAIPIGSQNITLPYGTQSNINFTWNVTSLTYGNYTMSAYSEPVPDEIQTVDNNYTDGVVAITIPGDINGDFKVTLQDLVLLANAYGTKPGDTKWNPNADINGDGKVSLSDLVLMANHYGQHYP
jgi:hypothetical protein